MQRRIFSRYSDAFLALFVVAVAVLLLVPIPPTALDFLLATNISFALLLLLVGLYMPNALALLAFPAVLLLTTLFRLGLNVASTRLILANEGEAGEVIEAFGTFLIGGELVVGVIIFVIISLVNFIVIARGASRVSEVAARFALESLPGKQMAIDADLRTGLLDARQAQDKRDELRKESQLYGAMDGAMKFVQGDVIAGFFITLTNILGGLYMGIVKGGMSVDEAIQTYSMLTVGDGLVTQIPALLISICAGVVVTRVSSGENTTLGVDLGTQLFTRPTLLGLAGGMVLIIGFLPGLPLLPFFTIALLLTIMAFLLRKSQQAGLTLFPFALEGSPPLPGLPMGTDPSTGEQEVQITVFLDSAVLYKRYSENPQFYQQWWRELQMDFFYELGLKLPGLQVVADEYLAGSHYSTMVGGVQVETAEIALDSVLVEVNPDNAVLFGMQILEIADHPVSEGRVFWTAKTDNLLKILEAGRIRHFDFMQFICLQAAVFVARNPEEALNIGDVHSMLKQLEQKHPGLAADALNSEFLNVFRLTEILQELVREGIGIRDFKQIFESVAAYCSTYGLSMVQQDDFDLQDIVSFIRINRKRHAIARLLSDRGTLKVFTLSQELEELLEDSPLESGGAALAIEPETFEKATSNLASILTPLKMRGLLPVSVLCRSDLRYRVSSFLRACDKNIGVIAFEELDPRVIVEPTGVWEV